MTDANTPASGGEVPEYAVNTLAEGPEVYQGSYTTTSTYYFPTETVASWDKYVQGSPVPTDPAALAQTGGARRTAAGSVVLNILVSAAASSFVAFLWFS